MIGFLDLPAELRLEIYGYIINTDTEIEIKLTKQSLSHDAEPTHRYITAWCNTILACRQIAHELKNHMDENGCGERCRYNTWTLYLSTTHTADKLPAAMKLPCSSSQLKAVQVKTPRSYDTYSVPYDIDWTLNRLVRFGPRWKNERVVGCPLSFQELILSFPAPDKDYWSERPLNYREEEVVALAFGRMQRRWSDGKNPVIAAFNKVTVVVTDEYEQSWSMIIEEDRKDVQGLLCRMVAVCSGRSSTIRRNNKTCSP